VNADTEPSSDGCKGEVRDVPEDVVDAGEGWLSTRPSLSEEDLTATGLGRFPVPVVASGAFRLFLPCCSPFGVVLGLLPAVMADRVASSGSE